MNTLQTIIIAIVEGLTEFLPVSSTGHMIIFESLLGVESTDFVKYFTVNIQFGAILSVVVLYWKRFFKMNQCQIFNKQGLEDVGFQKKIATYWKRLIYKYDFYWKLFLALIPGFVLGMTFDDMIDRVLGSVEVVAIMLVVGGVLMLFVDKWFKQVSDDQSITTKRAWAIGLSQCVAMFLPGFSRSMSSIVGGMMTKLNRKNAAEFSFFLAVPTMLGASLIKGLQYVVKPGGYDMIMEHIGTLVLGNIVAFVVALFAIKFFINFLTKYGFKAFGWYRIVVGGIILILLWQGVSLQML